MTPRPFSALVTLAALLFVSAVGSAAPEIALEQSMVPETTDPISSIHAWQVDEAEQALMLLRSAGGDETTALTAEILIAFHRGDYEAALDALERHPNPAGLAPYDRLVTVSARLRADAVKKKSEHFGAG